jgi:phytoene dehydrogenase-like protein
MVEPSDTSGTRETGDRPKVLVVGGGLAGLAAAAFAARANTAVTVAEARAVFGGRARTNRVERGYLFNQGPHALYAGGPAMRVLHELGIEPRGGRPPLRAWGTLRGRLALLPATPKDALRTNLVGLRAKIELGRVLGQPEKLLTYAAGGRSFAQWLDEHIANADARALAQMLGRVATYCADADAIAADAVVPQIVMAMTDGVRYLDGGWQRLADALARSARDAGAVIDVTTRVDAIRRAGDDDGFVVDTSAGTMRASAVIVAAGGPPQVDHLLGGTSAAVAAWAARAHPVHASSLDLALARLPRPERRVAFGVDAPLYLSTHTPSADLGGDGGEVMHVMRYGDDAKGTARDEIEAFLDVVQPGWRAELIAEQYGRQLVVAHGRPEPATSYAGRPGPAVDDAPGVFVAGDWVGGEGLLADAALASAAAAARGAIQHVGQPIATAPGR